MRPECFQRLTLSSTVLVKIQFGVLLSNFSFKFDWFLLKLVDLKTRGNEFWSWLEYLLPRWRGQILSLLSVWRGCKCMLIYKNLPSKMIFLVSRNFFMNFAFKNGCKFQTVKIVLRIRTKNHATNQEIGFSQNRFESRVAAYGHSASVGVNRIPIASWGWRHFHVQFY